MKKTLFVGIDPSGSKAGTIGICAAYAKTEIELMKVCDFFTAQDVLMELFYKASSDQDKPVPVAVIEDSNISGGAFYRGLTGKRREKQNRDLGKNQFCSHLLIEWCKKMGFRTIAISPKNKGKKWSEDLFLKQTQYDGKVLKKHQHAIDGYSMIHRFLVAKKPEQLIQRYLK